MLRVQMGEDADGQPKAEQHFDWSRFDDLPAEPTQDD